VCEAEFNTLIKVRNLITLIYYINRKGLLFQNHPTHVPFTVCDFARKILLGTPEVGIFTLSNYVFFHIELLGWVGFWAIPLMCDGHTHRESNVLTNKLN